MRVTVNKRELQRALARCQGVADKKGTMPVLANILLQTAETGQLMLAATDLFLSVQGTIAAEVDREGSIALGAKDFYERVRMMPEGLVTVESLEGAQTTLKAAQSARRYTLHGLPGSEFPQLPKAPSGVPALTLEVTTLASLIAKTHFSISLDDTRPHLNSALLEWDGRSVRMVTTDGHRLSKLELELPETVGKASILVPLKAIHELRRLCEETPSDVKSSEVPKLQLSQGGPNAFFTVAGFTFSVKLVDAQFPPYEQVIPKSSAHRARVARPPVAEALRAVSLAANERTGGVKISLTRDAMRLSSESPESGDSFDEVPVEYDGPDMTIGFNARYLVDVLAAIDTDQLDLGVSGELDPAVIRPADQAPGSSYLAVIMPMRV